MAILGVICGMILVACLTDLLTWTGVLVVPFVTDVLVSPSSVVAEILIGNLLNRSPLLSPQSARVFGWRIKKK